MASFLHTENKTIDYLVIGNEIQIGDGRTPAIDNIYNETLVIPSKIENKPVTIIGKRAFFECNIGEIVLPGTLTTISEAAFQNFRNCKQLISPSSVIDVGHNSFASSDIRIVDFSKCEFQHFQGTHHFLGANIEKLLLPSSLVSLPVAFLWGSTITELTFPKSLYHLDNTALMATYRLTLINSDSPYFIVHNNIVYSPDFKILYKYPAGLSIDILPSVTTIKGASFSGCSLVNISFKNKIRVIETKSLRLCPNLKYCDLRNIYCSEIPHAFLAECPLLETVIFPITCNSLDSYILEDCPSVKFIYFLSNIHKIAENFISTSNVHIYYCGNTQIDASVPSSTVIHVTKSFPKEINQLMNIDITYRDYECTYSNEILQFFNQYAFLCTVRQICYQQFSFWSLYPIIFL